jgi:DNA-3-methyladenine glycosylase II
MPNLAPPYANDAVAHLKRVDPILGDVIDRAGPYLIPRRPERFQALVRAIIFQQLAGRAAQTIFDRFVTQVGGKRFPTPAQVLAATDEMLRAAGLSRGKMAYVRDLAAHVRDRTLNFHRFAQMDDDAIIADLTRVRGIGRWTAEMFLMFNLHRPDVFPVDDLGVRNAVARLYAMSAPPPPKELREFGERWRPYRTVAAWYLWQSMSVVTPGDSTAKAAAKPKPKTSAKKASHTGKAPTRKLATAKIATGKNAEGKSVADKPAMLKAAPRASRAKPAATRKPRSSRNIS